MTKHLTLTLLAVMILTAGFIPSASLAIDLGGDTWTGSLDTTLSWGIRSRLDDPDPNLIGIPNGGNAFSVNGDDGNLNYDTGIVSNAGKFTNELLLERGRFGSFIRVTGFLDFENKEGDRERSPLTGAAKDTVGSDLAVLDAYLWGNFSLGEKPIEVRFGNQVLSWGESTFIQNSINTINPIDVSKIRVPGAELREALTPIPILSGSIGTTENTSLEVFLQLGWKETEIDPPSTYFSTSDFAGPGGTRVQLGFGAVAEGPLLGIPRAEDNKGRDSGQYGLAYRAFVPALNDTEFGFYFINYHSRLPLISARTGTSAGADVYTAAGVTAGTNPLVDGLATIAYAPTARYFIEYPENIQLYGISLNSTIGGWAIQGEVSHRDDVPLQVDDVELLFAALSALNPNFKENQLSQFLNGGNVYGLEQVIHGFILRDVSQVQATVTRLLPQMLGASQLLLLGEVGLTRVHDMPDKNELRLEAPGTYISGNQALAAQHTSAPGQFEDPGHFADATSWGYRLVGRLEYSNAIGAWNLLPRIAFAEDVNGNSPGPGGNFLEGRRALTFGLGANYQSTWSVDINYTRFSGAGRYNLINDRDFVAYNVKVAF
jgi:hypothetical protein